MTTPPLPRVFAGLPFRSRARLGTLLGGIDRWFDRRLQYAALAELDDARLRDIGLSPEEVRRIRARQYW